MLIDLTVKGCVIVRRETTDPKFYKNESLFLHHLKKGLIRLGHDCIKKRVWKDGHLVDDDMMYIRHRKGDWYIYDTQHAVRIVSSVFDTEGEVKLALMINREGAFYNEAKC